MHGRGRADDGTRGEEREGRGVIFLVRLLVNAAALWVATHLVPGVSYAGGWLSFLGVALVFGFVNAFIRPVAKILTFPLIIVTFGIFSLVVKIGRASCRERLWIWVVAR